jgi:hypothetical protein
VSLDASSLPFQEGGAEPVRLRDGLKAVDFKNNRVILNEIYKNILKRRRLTPFVGGSTVYYELR